MSSPQSIALAKRVAQTLQAHDRRGLRVAVLELFDTQVPLGKSWRSLAEPLLDFGEISLACAAIDQYVAWSGSTPQALVDQAAVYARSARPSDAAAIMDRVAPDVPDAASNAYLRGTLALNLGMTEKARDLLYEALGSRPLSGKVAYALAMTGSMARDPDSADRILASLAKLPGAPSAEQGMYRYAIGKVMADQGDADGAFAAYAAGAEIVARTRPYDAEHDRANAERAAAGWTRATIDRIANRVTIPTNRPIVVTGLPRSGTTLAEQILVSHSAVDDGDELGRFGLIVQDMGGAHSAAVERLTDRSVPDRAVAEYLRLVAERFPGSGRIVDKTLEASRYLGAYAALLPDAPILWIRRAPLDCAWSTYSNFFMSGLAWTFDQTAIAAHFRLEDALLKRWQDVLGERLNIISYESLVTDKETVIPQMLRHCGLAEEPQTLHPERTERLVRTASVAQVREPITARGIGTSAPYRHHLQPFIDSYGDGG